MKEELNDLHGVPVRVLGLHCLFLLQYRLFELILQCSLRGYTDCRSVIIEELI